MVPLSQYEAALLIAYSRQISESKYFINTPPVHKYDMNFLKNCRVKEGTIKPLLYIANPIIAASRVRNVDYEKN